jgi:hypothetical protein
LRRERNEGGFTVESIRESALIVPMGYPNRTFLSENEMIRKIVRV